MFLTDIDVSVFGSTAKLTDSPVFIFVKIMAKTSLKLH